MRNDNPVRYAVLAYNKRLPRGEETLTSGSVMTMLGITRRKALTFLQKYGRRVGRQYVMTRSEFERLTHE